MWQRRIYRPPVGKAPTHPDQGSTLRTVLYDMKMPRTLMILQVVGLGRGKALQRFVSERRLKAITRRPFDGRKKRTNSE